MNDPFSKSLNSIDLRKVAQAAKKDALAGVPSENDDGLPEGFIAINDTLRKAYDTGVANCQNELNEVENQNDHLTSRINPVTLGTSAQKIIDEMADKLAHSDSKGKVRYHKQEFLNRKDDLKRFKLENDLIYDPSRGIDKSSLPFGVPFSALFVFLLYLIESLFNGFMFIIPMGLLPGLVISLSASLVNVILGYFVGRYVVSALVHSPSIVMRLVSALISAVFLFIITWLNLMIAVVRSILDSTVYGNLNTSQAVWPFANLDLINFNGALLVGVGFVFAISAVMDGWFADDPYPGFGSKYRTCLKQKWQVEKHLGHYKASFHKETSEARDALNSFFEHSAGLIDTWGRNINLVQKRFVDYQDWVESLSITQRNCWETYLASHERNRLDTYRAPKDFSKPPAFFVSKPDHDPSHVFSDVAHSFMTDTQRLKRMAEFTKTFGEKHEVFSAELDKVIEKLRVELSGLEEEAECHI